jgi:hypothetical protein
MEFWLILGTNLYSRLPAGQVPPGQLEVDHRLCTECPRVGGGFRRTSEVGRYFARVFRGSDAFEVFAADWGGCRCGICDVDQYIRYVQFHSAHLAEEQPAARVWANLWSISDWGPAPGGAVSTLVDPRWRQVWDAEITSSRRFLASLHEVPGSVGVAFPLHHWYRGFCQQWYSREELPDWPELATLSALAARGRRLAAWTHFIVENDPYHGRLWGTLSVRLRYIRELCKRLAEAPFDVAMGNVYSARQSLNLYAFSRWCHEPDLTIDEILSDYVSRIALPAGRSLLTDLIVYLENRDPWHDDMPNYGRLPSLPEGGLRREALVAALDTLHHHLRPDAPLLLNGRENFARTVAAAFALHEE